MNILMMRDTLDSSWLVCRLYLPAVLQIGFYHLLEQSKTPTTYRIKVDFIRLFSEFTDQSQFVWYLSYFVVK